MAHAYKCDRCGKLFEIDLITRENYPEYKVEHKGMQCDLCNSCQEALSCFLARKTYSPSEVYAQIVIHGQEDDRFAQRETIKYSPTEVEKILEGEKNDG